MKFGLKLGAFAALAAALSSCLVVIDDGNSGPPTVSSVQAQATYCSPGNAATDVTNLDFKFNYTGNVDIDRIEAAWVVIPFNSAAGGRSDASVTDPLVPPAGFNVRSTVVSGTLINYVSGRTYKGTLRLTMGTGGGNVGDADIPTDLQGIKAQAISSNSPARLWIRGITKTGTTTPWSKASNITEPETRDPGPCDGGV